MRFFAILLLFLLAVAGSAFLAQTELREDVEKELAGKSRSVLEKAGFPGVSVSFDHLHASLGGTVDRPEDRAAVLEVLRRGVPTAIWPEDGEVELAIRPTLPPRLRVSRGGDGGEVTIEGVLAAQDEAGRAMLGARLHALPGVGGVDNSITFDPMVLPFPKMAEFASLAAGLLAHPGEIEVTLESSRLSARGAVPNAGLKQGLLELAAQAGAGSFEDHIEVVAPTSFTRTAELKITRNRFGVVLSGVYPSEQDRDALAAVFRKNAPALTVTNRVEVSDECGPASWQEKLDELVPVLLANLGGEMTVEFGPGQVRVSGRVADEKAREVVLASLEPLRAGEEEIALSAELTLGQAHAGAALELTAVFEGGLLILSGRSPGTGFVETLEARLGEVHPKISIKSELEPAASAGPAWTTGLTEFFVESLGRLSTGTFTFKNGVLGLQGRTLALPDRQLIQNLAVNTVPPSYRIENHLLHADQPFPKPALLPEQRTRLSEALKAFPVYFEKNSEVVKEEEKSKVASIAAAIKETGADVELVVTGFSDSVGNSEANKALSLRRAANVQAELIRLGVPESNLSLESVEEDVSGVPRSQQWKSRRVEVAPGRPTEDATTTF